MKNRDYKNIIVNIVITVFFLGVLFFCFGCQSVRYVKAELPAYEIEEIERPQIKTATDDVVKLIEYAKIREIQLNNFIKFYNELREQNK